MFSNGFGDSVPFVVSSDKEEKKIYHMGVPASLMADRKTNCKEVRMRSQSPRGLGSRWTNSENFLS